MDKYTGKFYDVLKSKRFISSLVIVVLALASSFVPELEDNFEEISMIATASIIALVSGYSLQDIVIAVVTGRQIPEVIIEPEGEIELEVIEEAA